MVSFRRIGWDEGTTLTDEDIAPMLREYQAIAHERFLLGLNPVKREEYDHRMAEARLGWAIEAAHERDRAAYAAQPEWPIDWRTYPG